MKYIGYGILVMTISLRILTGHTVVTDAIEFASLFSLMAIMGLALVISGAISDSSRRK